MLRLVLDNFLADECQLLLGEMSGNDDGQAVVDEAIHRQVIFAVDREGRNGFALEGPRKVLPRVAIAASEYRADEADDRAGDSHCSLSTTDYHTPDELARFVTQARVAASNPPLKTGSSPPRSSQAGSVLAFGCEYAPRKRSRRVGFCGMRDRKPNLKSSWQEHDIWYVVDRVQDAYWQQPWQVIQQVVASCKEEVKPIEGREKLLAVAKEKMRAIAKADGDGDRDGNGDGNAK